MKIRGDCIPCILNRVIYETDLARDGDDGKGEDKVRILAGACRIIGGADSNTAVNELATEVHRANYKMLCNADPYSKIKKKSNDVAKSLLPVAEEIIFRAENRLKAAAICSIVGNILDFGILGSSSTEPEELIENFEEFYMEGLGEDDLSRMRKLLNGKVLFFCDNCGEIFFDALLCRELKNFDIELIVVVKGEPMLTDATLEDAHLSGIDRYADKLLTTNSNAVWINFNEIGDDLREEFESANLIISKGMANYEAFSECGCSGTKLRCPIIYLLRTKCTPIAEDMGLERDINVAKFFI